MGARVDFEGLGMAMGYSRSIRAIQSEADAEIGRANGEIRKANGFIAEKNRRISVLEDALRARDGRIALLERTLAGERRKVTALEREVATTKGALNVQHADSEGMAAMAVSLARELQRSDPDSTMFQPSGSFAGDGGPRLGMHEPYCEAFDKTLAAAGVAEPWRYRRSA